MPLYLQYPLSARKLYKKLIALLFRVVLLVLPVLLPAGIVALVLTLTGVHTGALAYIESALPLLGALMFAFLVLGMGYAYMYMRTYRYDATGEFITIKKGVLSSREIHVPFAKVQDVWVDQDVVDRVLGLYDVHLASATTTSGVEAHIDGVASAQASGLKETLLTRIQAHNAHMPTTKETTHSDASPQEGGEVSSTTYPIAARWFIMRICNRLLVFLCVVALVQGMFLYTYQYPGFWKALETLGVTPGLVWLVVLGVSALVFLVLFVHTLLWLWGYSFVFLPAYIQLKNGVISRSEKHLPYTAVQDVIVAQGMMERVFGLATVLVQNAAGMGGSVYLPGQSQEKAQGLCAHIRSRMLTAHTTRNL